MWYSRAVFPTLQMGVCELEQLVVAAVKRSNLDHFQVDLDASSEAISSAKGRFRCSSSRAAMQVK
jgi:hypothetical protein